MQLSAACTDVGDTAPGEICMVPGNGDVEEPGRLRSRSLNRTAILCRLISGEGAIQQPTASPIVNPAAATARAVPAYGAVLHAKFPVKIVDPATRADRAVLLHRASDKVNLSTALDRAAAILRIRTARDAAVPERDIPCLQRGSRIDQEKAG
jgi:hypothetical protein